MNLSNKKILVTGGSSGIGKALIELLAGEGVADIAVVGRSRVKLDDLEKSIPSVRLLTIQGDVSKLTDIKNTVSVIKQRWGELDILVNSAGVVSAGLLSEIPDEDITDQVNINLAGLILMTKYALPLLKESEEGAVINFSSGLGYIAMPYYTVYAATKAAVHHFSEGIRRELADYPLHIMTVSPTATDTNMMKTTNTGNMDSPEQVANATIAGLHDSEIDVVLGGSQRKEDIRTNFEEPLKMDEKLKVRLEALKIRAKNHRAM